jgi:hypothetical protein
VVPLTYTFIIQEVGVAENKGGFIEGHTIKFIQTIGIARILKQRDCGKSDISRKCAWKQLNTMEESVFFAVIAIQGI